VAAYNIKVTVCHTAGHYGEEYDDGNSDVFRSRRNCISDDAQRTDGGRAFHARAAATGKARSPSVVRRVDRTTSVDAEAPRRRRLEPTSAVRWRVSARYDGAMQLRQRYAKTHNRKWILSGTFSQCSSRTSGVTCSDFLAENTRRAAALKTDCSRCNSCQEMPERTELQYSPPLWPQVRALLLTRFDDCSEVSTHGDICVNIWWWCAMIRQEAS